jgi:hypothetical protein
LNCKIEQEQISSYGSQGIFGVRIPVGGIIPARGRGRGKTRPASNVGDGEQGDSVDSGDKTFWQNPTGIAPLPSLCTTGAIYCSLMVCQILSEMMLNFKHRLICNMQYSWLELMSATVLCIKQIVLPGRHACHNVRPCILNQVQHTRCSTCNDNHNNTTPS